MAFSEIMGHAPAIEQLKRAIANNRVPSAYLFAGPHHIGKGKVARALTQTLNCLSDGDDACHHCSPCSQLEHGSFPDYMKIEPDGQFVKIGQIKAALKWLELRPSLGAYRVLVIDEAEKMNVEAGNAFLKTLEEPPPQTLIILLAEHPQKLLETIVSRCQVVRFRLLNEKAIRLILSQESGIAEEHSEFLVQFAQGQIRSQWIEQPGVLQKLRDSVLEVCQALQGANMTFILEKCELWGTPKEKNWKLVLDFLECLFRDLALMHQGFASERLFNRDRGPALQSFYQKFQSDKIDEGFQLVVQTRERIQMNARPSLALMALWIQLKRYMVP